jgi:predicted metal-dependent hydrolase
VSGLPAFLAMTRNDKILAPKDLGRQAPRTYLRTMPLSAETTTTAFPARNVRFALDAEVPRHWHPAGRAVTLFFDNLSLFFPPGERFFVAAVKRHAHLVDDERLRAEVQAFCEQEGFHSREHVRYNRMLEAQGLPATALETRVERILRVVTRVLRPRARLAATCALEHFTATLGQYVLADPRLMAGANPTMKALWEWHAAEEIEHKAVAWDVYVKSGQHLAERRIIMALATVIFWSLVLEQQVRFMYRDGILFSLREWRSLFRFLFVEPGSFRKMWSRYLDYYRPGFHPWQHDNRALVEEWKRGYASGRSR